MNPILLGDDLTDGLRDLVRASFDISSPAFAGMIDRFLEEPRNFIQGPWISVDMPFRPAAANGQPFPEIPMDFTPHAHQARAFERLRAPHRRSTLVATGTGSGKTECYLMPILDDCRARIGEPGVKAIIIYPMNALASDQARRIAKLVAGHESLQGVRCGIYAGEEPKITQDAMTSSGVITSRAAMRDNPPDILLTNYKMLDYLLVRGEDQALWAANEPETLRYLVVDELHTFDGAQGADLALLIRRLRDRLGVPAGRLACVGTSATLGSDANAEGGLLAYAADLFGDAFDADAVIREDRLAANETLPTDTDYEELPDPADLATALAEAQSLSQPAAAERLAVALFGDDVGEVFRADDEPTDLAWRYALGEGLKRHADTRKVLSALDHADGPCRLESIVAALADKKRYREWQEGDLTNLVRAIVALLSYAREERGGRAQPVFSTRVQIWAREMVRMTGRIGATLPDGGHAPFTLHHSDDLDAPALRASLPIIHCSHCGTAGHLCHQPERGTSVARDLHSLYREFFDEPERARILYHHPIVSHSGRAAAAILELDTLDYSIVDVSTPALLEAQRAAIRPGQALVWIYDPNTVRPGDKTCPACGTPHALQILGLRAARLTAALATALFNSEDHEMDPRTKPRVLMFSDSVQDAAQRAAVTEIRNTAATMRKTLWQAIEDQPDRTMTLADIISDLPKNLRNDLGDARFVARHIQPTQGWRDEYKTLCRTGLLPGGPLADDVEIGLGWEYFSDLTYRAHTAPTLEATRLVATGIHPEQIAEIAARALPRIQEEMRQARADAETFTDDRARLLVDGILDVMRRRGAIATDVMIKAAERAIRKRGPNFHEAHRILGLLGRRVLPTPDARTAVAPEPAILDAYVPVTMRLIGDSGVSWIEAWLDRVFEDQRRSAPLLVSRYAEILKAVIDHAVACGVLTPVEARDGFRLYMIRPEHVLVTTHRHVLACDSCARQETVSAHERYIPRPCRRIGCAGTLRQAPAGKARLAASTYLERLFSTDRTHRVVGREHTGILKTDDRLALERDFIDGEKPWHPSLVSATPTLEMGIDIGDLSSLLLCSVPPEEANYVQRIGRTGRRDGNSVNVTLANARPHDLQFWEAPGRMISGKVKAPGVHLSAAAVLKRQMAAFSLDRMARERGPALSYGQVKDILADLEKGTKKSILPGWVAFLQKHGAGIGGAFIALLPARLRKDGELVRTLAAWMENRPEGTLIAKIHDTFEAALKERRDLQAAKAEINNELKRLRAMSPPPTDLDEQIEALKDERDEITDTINDQINDVRVLQFLTDRGVLPNYAFPEEGVKLKAVLTRPANVLEGGRPSHTLREYVRPAASALSELAPFQTFYAEGREVVVNRIDLDTRALETWRFCPACTHSERDALTRGDEACPKCGSDMWSDKGQAIETIQMRTVVAKRRESEASIRDADERRTRRFVEKMFPSYADEAVTEAWSTPADTETPFGFEFIANCEFRHVNFGEEREVPSSTMVSGDRLRTWPFRICSSCGTLQTGSRDPEHPGDHQSRCKAIRAEKPRAEWEREIVLMRRFSTEALRIVMPIAGAANDDEIKSFTAAIDLGLRKRFAGKVDHIRSTIVEEPLDDRSTMRSLYLYDSIPGGSGYLRQIARRPEDLRRVLEAARDALRDCTCAKEDTAALRDGCHACVKTYRAQFGRGVPSRRLADALMSSVLSIWPELREAGRSVDAALRDSLIQSELEHKFLARLDAAFGPDALTRTTNAVGGRAYQLVIRKPGAAPIYWTVEPQVELHQIASDMPRKRIDFLFTARSHVAPPIIVELDGWEWHKDTIARDIRHRLEMKRSTIAVDVYTLTWSDLEDSPAAILNPLAAKRLPKEARDLLPRIKEMFDQGRPGAELIQQGVDLAIETPSGSACLDLLLSRLRGDEHPTAPVANIFALLALKAPQADPAGIVEAEDELFLSEAEKALRAGDGPLDVWIATRSGKDAAKDPASFRILIRPEIDALDAPSWRGLWRLLALFQGFPGLHVALHGHEELSPPRVRAGEDEAASDAWDEVMDLVFDDVLDVARRAATLGLPPPDLVGADMMQGVVIVGSVDIGWSDRKIAVVEEAFELPGWTILAVGESGMTPADIIAALSERFAQRETA